MLQDVVSALRALSGSYAHNTKRARQHLRSDLERSALTVNDEFLAAFESVHKVLSCLHLPGTPHTSIPLTLTLDSPH
jgi:hypothetical protein